MCWKDRTLLQWIGGKVNLWLDRSLWYDEINREAGIAQTEGCDVYTAAGLRYPNDAEVWRAGGGIVADIYRPGYDKLFQSNATEASRQLIKPDFRVINDGTLQQLHSLAAQVISDVDAGQQREMYVASSF